MACAGKVRGPGIIASHRGQSPLPAPGPALEERDRAQPTKTARSLVPELGPAVRRGRITPSRGTRQGGAHHDAEDAAANRLLRDAGVLGLAICLTGVTQQRLAM